MKIKVDEKVVLELNKTQKKVIMNDIESEIFQEDMERRVAHILKHKYENCYKRLKQEWEPRLKGRVESIPLDNDLFSELVFSQPDYKNRSQRETESVD